VLVGGTAMPESTQLPGCLVPLTRCQALEITDHRFHADVGKLIKALGKAMGVPTSPQYLSHLKYPKNRKNRIFQDSQRLLLRVPSF